MKTTDFDARRRAVHEKVLGLMNGYADELDRALVNLKEKNDNGKLLTPGDIESGLRMLGLGLQRVGLPAELRDGKDNKEKPPKAGSRLKKLRIVG